MANDELGVRRLLDLARRTWPETRQEELATVLEAFRSAQAELDQQASEVAAGREAALKAIQEHEDAVQQDRERLAGLTKNAEAIAHGVASDALSREYAEDARKTQRVAWWFTAVAITVGAGAAVLAGVITLEYANADDPDILLGLAKSAIALPIALLAAYLGKLAGRYRDIAWRLRHMALQLRTAELYIAELGQDRRGALIEQLALRFFPGQPQDITAGGDGPDGPGLMAVLPPTGAPPS